MWSRFRLPPPSAQPGMCGQFPMLLMFVGRVFGGQNGMLIALVLAAVMNFVSYFFSDKIALAMYRARPVSREELPRAYQAVERLTQKIGIPMPKMYVIPTDSRTPSPPDAIRSTLRSP